MTRNTFADDNCPQPRRWSQEWYEREAESPVGTRQVYKYGKLWPPYPRPTGPKQTWVHRFYSAHYWPLPYVCDDRAYVQDVTQMQVANGWSTETTLYDYHFAADSLSLERSGRMQLEWILKHVPPEHRVVWVQTGDTPEASQQRLAAVQIAANEMIGDENVPPVMLRVTSPVGRPAVEIDMIRRAEMKTIPDPRVKYEALPSGTGGSGT